MSQEVYKKAFTFNHSRLVRQLTAFEAIEGCYVVGLITYSEKDEIESLKTDMLQLNRLFGIFHRRYFADREIFSKVFQVLKNVNDAEGGYIEHVILAIRDFINDPSSFSTVSDEAHLLSDEDRARLQLNEQNLINSLDVNQIIPDLISDGIISFEESFLIEHESDFKKRGQKLVQILTSRSAEIYRRFVEILRETEIYEQLAYKLVGTTETKQFDVEGVLRKGHVPPPPQNFVSRPELIKAIRKELRKLKDEDCWVLVSGLPGYGKTVLAAESVRSSSLLNDVFIGGVYWLNVGKMTNQNGEIDKAAQLEKIQNFIERMDKLKYRPSNLESATDYLQQVMNEQYPQCLLILDDVWEYETAQVFAVRCRTLVTSRNSFVADGIPTNHIYKVSVMVGFTFEEAKQILSKSTGIPVAGLPSVAKEIIKLSYGSPIALDIIGAMLKLNPTNARWESVVKKLREQRAGGLKLRRERAGSGSNVDFSVRRNSEQQRGGKETLNTLVSLSEECLASDIRECFRELVIFDPDTLISTETLTTLWDEDEFTAEENMMSIVGCSLAQVASKKLQNESFLSFNIHDMILSYLQDTVEADQKKTYHKNFVERIMEKCDGNFSQLVPDGYVYQKLLHHMFAAEMLECLGQLLSDLRWLAMSCIHWDSNSLLEAYKKYRNEVPDNYKDTVKEFQLFLSSNLDKLGKDVLLQDVIQLALNTTTSLNLLEQAKTAAKEHKDALWLVWCNQSTINRPSPFLQLQPHDKDEEVKYCQYYEEGNKVLSCSINVVKMWESSTGKVLESFGGHTNIITHCVISESGDLLVTCSDDTTCKVWEIEISKALLITFREHQDGVQYCDLSPDDSLVISVDIGSAIKLWYARTGKVKASWDQGDTGLTCCLFTPKGDTVIVSTQDGIIQSFNLNGQPLLCYCISTLPQSPSAVFDFSWSRGPSRSSSTGSNPGVTFTIHSCACSKDGTLLAAAIGDCTAKVWPMDSEKCVHSFRHSTDVLCVDFSPDGKFLATGSVSGMVKVWSLAEGCPVFDIPLHYDWVNCVKFSPQGTHILSSAFSGSIKIIENKHIERSWKLYRRRFTVLFNKNESGEYIPNMVCYDVVKDKLEICLGLDGHVVRSLDTISTSKPRSWDMSQDGKMIAVGFDNGTLQLFDNTGTQLWICHRAHDNIKILHCRFSPDCSLLVTCGSNRDNLHKVWSVADGSLLSYQPNCNDFWVKPCVFYNDSARIASTTPGRVLVWEARTGNKLFYCNGISDNVQESILCVNISKDNSKLIGSAANGYIAVWCAKTGNKLFTGSYITLSGNSQARFCSLNWNGTLAAVGHDDATFKIYNIETGNEIVKPSTNASGAWMISTEFSPDGEQIVTLSNSIQWWSAADGKLLKKFLLNSTFGKYIYFSPDFKVFVTIDNTGLLYILKYLNV